MKKKKEVQFPFVFNSRAPKRGKNLAPTQEQPLFKEVHL